MTIPLSLYVHIPWCVRKCPYCDFNSHTADTTLPETRYVDALLSDLDCELALTSPRPLQSIFLGGGTPSLFSGHAIARILDGIRARTALASDCEITLEANPGTADAACFADYRAAGVNRLSIGVQSFHATHLKTLGRIHNGDEAARAIRLAQQAGFTRINVDLMHGLPTQTATDAVNDLRTAVDSGVTHISWYQLTIEPNTVFYSKPPTLPTEPTLLAIDEAGAALLRAAGFSNYEVSAWSQPNERSRHNINYWSFGDYIGIGAGAHGKLTQHDGRIVRRWKTRLPNDYLDSQKSFVAGEQAISETDRAVEFFMNALRLREGVPAALFVERTGLSLASMTPVLTDLRSRGLLQPDVAQLATTEHGFRYLDSVLQAFM
ncbi:MAG TPA: radical SAM family heme chaperone HemW [Pseudomonadales bacterium]